MSYPIQKAGSASDVTNKNKIQAEYANLISQQIAVEAGIQGRVTYVSGGAGASSSLLTASQGNFLFTKAELQTVVANIISNTATNDRQRNALLSAANRFDIQAAPDYFNPVIRLLLNRDTANTGTSSGTNVVTNNGNVNVGLYAGRLAAFFPNSTSTYLTIPFNTAATDSFSISYWYYTIDTLATYQPWALSTGGSDGILAQISNANIEFYYYSGGETINTTIGLNPTSGNWNYITITVDISIGRSISYLNGVVRTTSNFSSSRALANETLTIGRNRAGNAAYKGYINNFMVHDFVLSPAQIQTLYAQTQQVLPTTVLFSPVAPVSFNSQVVVGLPRLIPGLSVWLDGADPAGTGTPPANGATVSTWVDKSGNGYTTSSVVGTPTYSSTSGIVFNGSSFFNLPNGSIPFNNSSYTLYFVLNFTNFSGSPGWFGSGAAAGNQSVSIRHEAGSIRIYWYGNDLSTTSTTLAGVTFLFGTQYQTGGQRTAFINGTAAGSDTPAARSQPNTGNTIGRAIDSAYINGSIREVIVYNRNHTTAQRQEVEGYLATKWSLKYRLPTNHPYYGSPPPLVLLTASSYSGSGTWNDTSGYGRNATLETGVIAKNAAGNGIVLNGSTSWTFPNVGVSNSWTIYVWYKNTGDPVGNASVISQIYSTSLIQLGNGDSGPARNMLGAFYVAGWRYGTTFTFTDGVWTNVQLTWNGTTMTTYINGSSIGSTTPGGTSADSGTAWRIGRRWDASSFMVGEIGEVRIYDAPLPASDVLNIYNTTRTTYL